MYQLPNDSHDTTQAHQPFSPAEQPSRSNPQSSTQFSKEKSRSRIITARVRLLPLNSGWSQPPLQASPAQSGTFQSPPIQPARPNIWQRYQSINRLTQVGVWCLAASLTLFLFVCSLGAIAGLKVQTTASQAVAAQSTIQVSTPTVAQNQEQPTQQSGTTPIPPTPTQTYATPMPVPQVATPIPVQPTQPLTGENRNPWGYDFVSPGNVITDPPAGFCSRQYFRCTKHFSDGQGYVVQCNDGLYSKSGGQSDVCSRHGGYKRTLYSHDTTG